MDSLWYPNDFTIEKGLKSLGAFMNFKGADTTRLYCKGCYTILMADHAAYEQKVVVTQCTNYDGFEALQDAELLDPQSRHFVKDLSEEQKKALPQWPGSADAVYQGVSDSLMAALPEIKKKAEKGNDMNFQKLLEKIGRPFIPKDELERMAGGPKTLMAQAADAAAPKIDPSVDGATEIKVSMKRSAGFYATCACCFMRGVEAKPAEEGKEAQ